MLSASHEEKSQKGTSRKKEGSFSFWKGRVTTKKISGNKKQENGGKSRKLGGGEQGVKYDKQKRTTVVKGGQRRRGHLPPNQD